ncbi:MAG: SBBP repeat-containing protein [Ardenticatenia bacterium]|nr:SBBP repeat-containing protein [Ardenticatenia bacterium]
MRRMIGKLGVLIFGGVTLMGLGLLTIGLVAVVRFDPVSVLPPIMSPEQPTTYALAKVPEATRQQLWDAYGKLPVSFVANQGQTGGQVRFLSRGSGYGLFLTSSEAVLVLRQSAAPATADAENSQTIEHAVLRMQLVGANREPQVVGLDELSGIVNYFISSDPQNWRTNIPTYARVQYQDVYAGVDLIYYGDQGQLEYDLVVAPGADPQAIRVRFEGADKISLDDQGSLVVHVPGGEVIQRAPVIYQEVDDVEQSVSGRYVLHGDHEVGFQVAAYDANRSLIIDPVLVYSSYLGGSERDYGHGIAVGADGSVYVSGETSSDNFPTEGPIQAARDNLTDAFVTKLSADGSSLIYSTYLGGSSGDVAYAIAVDAEGNAYVTGPASSDFPTTPGAFQTEPGGNLDAFVARLNPAGDALVYSTFLGGSGYDQTWGIAVGGDGSAYVTGSTEGPGDDFPVTPGAFQPSRGGPDPAAFVTKFNPAGSALEYSTHLGGSETDRGYDIAVHGGYAYVTGETASTDFPTTVGAFDTTLGAGTDAFVTKMNADGSGLVYSTYLGSSRGDVGFGIAVDLTGHAYVTGETYFDDFPTTPGAFQTSRGGSAGDNDSFVTRLNAAGDALICSSFLGGSNVEHGAGIAVDGAGNAYLTGWTASDNFPVVIPISGGSAYEDGEVYVTKVDTEACAIVHSSYLGGSEQDRTGGDKGDPAGNPIAVDAEGCVYVTGRTKSTDFPTTAGAFQTAFGGPDADGFVARICEILIYLPIVVKAAP